MHNTYPALLAIDLQLFNGAAAGATAGAAGEGSAQGEAGTLPKAETKSRRGSSRRSSSGDYDNVVFGKQEDAPAAEAQNAPATGETAQGKGESKSGVTTTSDTLEAKRQAFRELIEGEYKDQYTEMFQSAFNRRFKESKGMEQTINAQKPIMDMLMQRYKIADGDVAKLQSAIEQDNAYWSEAAEESGLTVEQYKAMQKLERENEELRRMRQRQIGEQQAQQKLAQWQQEADKVKEIYPSFDFRAETANRDFLGLLRSGVSVQQAYELMHMEEIKEAAARVAAQNAGQQVVAKLKSKAARPMENGMSSQSAVIVKNDVHSLSRADRAEAARRAMRGEKIRF